MKFTITSTSIDGDVLGRKLTCKSVNDLKNTIVTLSKQPFFEDIAQLTIDFDVDVDPEHRPFGGMPEGDPIKSDIMPEK